MIDRLLGMWGIEPALRFAKIHQDVMRDIQSYMDKIKERTARRVQPTFQGWTLESLESSLVLLSCGPSLN